MASPCTNATSRCVRANCTSMCCWQGLRAIHLAALADFAHRTAIRRGIHMGVIAPSPTDQHCAATSQCAAMLATWCSRLRERACRVAGRCNTACNICSGRGLPEPARWRPSLSPTCPQCLQAASLLLVWPAAGAMPMMPGIGCQPHIQPARLRQTIARCHVAPTNPQRGPRCQSAWC